MRFPILFRRRPKEPPPLAPQTHPLDVVIAHRAERTCNRDRALVAKYVRTNTILSRGR